MLTVPTPPSGHPAAPWHHPQPLAPWPIALIQRGQTAVFTDMLAVITEALPPGPRAQALVARLFKLSSPRGWRLDEMAAANPRHDPVLPHLLRLAEHYQVTLSSPETTRRARALSTA